MESAIAWRLEVVEWFLDLKNYSYEEMQSWVKDRSKLPPGYWIDDLPEPLHTVADVEEVFALVDRLAVARIVEKMRKGTYYPCWPLDRT